MRFLFSVLLRRPRAQPRPNEAGGKYGLGVIVRRYKTGQPVIIRVELTANHRGYFEFRLCPNNAPKRVASQACLDKYVLQRARTATAAAAAANKDADDTFHETRFYPGTENRVYEMRYLLPDGLTCSQCVLQWKYVAGNNWGMCANGTGAVGCGPQEEFRACADVSVSDRDGTVDTSPYPTETAPTAAPQPPARPSAGPADEDDGANEIPTGDANTPADREGAGRPSGVGLVVFVVSVVLLSLGFVVVVFAFVYWYYYHAGDTIKSWWRSVTDSSSYACVFRKRDDKQTVKNEKTEQPVPPPRVKKTTTTIGFKGVPDNLV